MASHLDTYCSYAGEMGLTADRELSFLSREDTVARMQSLIEMLGVGGESEALDVVAMDQADFENAKKAIMEDGDYQFLVRDFWLIRWLSRPCYIKQWNRNDNHDGNV